MQCLSCHGTGRGAFGGPCNNCRGTGETVGAMAGAQLLVGLAFLVVLAIVVVAAVH